MVSKTAAEGLLQTAIQAETAGEHAKAIKYYEASLAIFEVVHGSENPRICPLLIRLIALYERVQDFPSMIRLLDQAKFIATNATQQSTSFNDANADYDTRNIAPLCTRMAALDPDRLV